MSMKNDADYNYDDDGQDDKADSGAQQNDDTTNKEDDSSLTGSDCAKKSHKNRQKQNTANTILDDEDFGTFFEDDNDNKNKPPDFEQLSVIASERETDGGVSAPGAPHIQHQDDEDENLNCGRGILLDWKRTVGTHWLHEMTNFEQKTIAVVIFMFFAAVAPAITFGAIYEKTTDHYIGTVEMLAATAWVGIVYSLIGGQPIMINGGTGPILAFSGVLYKLSDTLDVPFLTLSAWVGIWVMILNALAAFINLNRMILYATRFTDEIFALLISVIFIINALGNPFAPVGIYYYFTAGHKSHEEHEDDEDYSYMATAFWSLILALGTTGFAVYLKGMKFSPFCCNQWARNTVADFAVAIAIFTFTAMDHGLFSQIKTEKLNVPDRFEPTYACCTSSCDSYWPDDCEDQAEPFGRRPWFVDLWDLNGKTWVPFMAAVPAFLAFILVFLDDGITLHLINHPSHKLTHGDAYNLNTLIIGVMVGVNALFGFPWLVAATVRSLNHLHALADKTQDGKFECVLETRLTNLMVHVLIMCTIFVLPLLKLIPVPVLYGVFLFMGITSLATNQFYGRVVMMLLMQPQKYPSEPYTRHIDTNRMHLYTAIQMLVFAILFVVKSIKVIAIAFPIVIALCIPIRMYLLPQIFQPHELILLDSEDAEIEEWVRKSTHPIDSEEENLVEGEGADTSSGDLEMSNV